MSTPNSTSQKPDLPNFYKINDNFFRGGQPSEAGIKKLAELGIKTIINLRGNKNKRVGKEKVWAENAGVKFIHFPLSNWFASSHEKIEKVLSKIIDAENLPVFLHCKRGADRTGTVVAVYRMKFENWTATQANQEAKQFGIGWWQVWMKDYINDYYKKLEK
jgi:tyrosine-protein phosphatase SIW14